jgi:hypothetical protein
MNAEEFERKTGHEPIQDDLLRANCKDAGKIGHDYCGVCVHGYPKFLVCPNCKKEEKP